MLKAAQSDIYPAEGKTSMRKLTVKTVTVKVLDQANDLTAIVAGGGRPQYPDPPTVRRGTTGLGGGMRE